jgi:hypothetical protein
MCVEKEAWMSDERNPSFIFHLTHTDLLVKALNGEIDLKALAEAELCNRGLDRSGRWIGFEAAKRLWRVKTYVVQTEEGPRRVTVPVDEPDEG